MAQIYQGPEGLRLNIELSRQRPLLRSAAEIELDDLRTIDLVIISPWVSAKQQCSVGAK